MKRLSFILVALAVSIAVAIAIASQASAGGQRSTLVDPLQIIKTASTKARKSYPDVRFVSLVIEGVDKRGRHNAKRSTSTLRFKSDLAHTKRRRRSSTWMCSIKVKVREGKAAKAVPIHAKCRELRPTRLPRCTVAEVMRKALDRGLVFSEPAVLSYYGSIKAESPPLWTAFSGDSFQTVADDC